jgi:hypothetical protein
MPTLHQLNPNPSRGEEFTLHKVKGSENQRTSNLEGQIGSDTSPDARVARCEAGAIWIDDNTVTECECSKSDYGDLGDETERDAYRREPTYNRRTRRDTAMEMIQLCRENLERPTSDHLGD